MSDEPDQKPIVGDDGELLKADTSVEYRARVPLHQPNDPLLADSPPLEVRPTRGPSPSKRRQWAVITAIILSFAIWWANSSHVESDGSANIFRATITPLADLPVPLPYAYGIRTSRASTSTIHDIEWSPDSTHLAIDNFDGRTRIWDVASETETLVLDHSASVVRWSPDGKQLLTATSEGSLIWDAETGGLMTTLNFNGYAAVHSYLEWSLDGSQIAAVAITNPRTLTVYDAVTGQRSRVFDFSDLGIEESITGIAWTQIGIFAITPHNIIFVNNETWEREIIQHISDTYSHWVSVDASADGDTFVVSKRINVAEAEVLVWSAAPTTTMGNIPLLFESYSLEQEPAAVRNLLWQQNNRLFSTSDGAGIYIWDRATGERASQFFIGQGLVDTAWSLDGRYVAACSTDFVQIYPAWIAISNAITFPQP